MSETNLYELIFRQTYEISQAMKDRKYENVSEEEELIGKYIAYHDLINKAGLVSEYRQYKQNLQN